jgi:hypothetical protein
MTWVSLAINQTMAAICVPFRACIPCWPFAQVLTPI